MNIWIKKACDFAAQRNYLDELFRVYPTDSDVLRDIDGALWEEIERNFEKAKEDTSDENKIALLSSLFKLNVFPIKDSYVAYLRKDPSALKRNPATVSRLVARVFQLGLDEVYKRSSAPKESNRQIGPMFKNWVAQGKGSRSEIQNLSDSSRFSECAAQGRALCASCFGHAACAFRALLVLTLCTGYWVLLAPMRWGLAAGSWRLIKRIWN